MGKSLALMDGGLRSLKGIRSIISQWDPAQEILGQKVRAGGTEGQEVRTFIQKSKHAGGSTKGPLGCQMLIVAEEFHLVAQQFCSASVRVRARRTPRHSGWRRVEILRLEFLGN